MNREEREMEVDILQLCRAVWDKGLYIVLISIITGLLGLVVSTAFLPPIYEASAKMIVNTRKDDSQNITNDQLNSAKNLVETYAVIIRSRDVVNRVITELNLEENYEQLVECIRVKAVNNTQVMQIVVRHKSRTAAFDIADRILKIAPDVIVETVEAGSVKPVEQAYAAQKPMSPSVLKNTILAALVGFMLSCGVVVVISLADNTYKSDMDIQNDLDMPVLGVIPTIESCNVHTGYNYGRRIRKGEKSV